MARAAQTGASADAITDAFIRSGGRVVDAIEGAYTQRLGEAGLLVTGIPVPMQNGVLTIRTSASVFDVERLLDVVAATGLPHRLTIRAGCSQELVDLARTRGLVETESLPLMSLERGLDSVRIAAQHPDLVIRQLAPEEAGVHAAIGADVFQWPLETFERASPPSILRMQGFRAYVGVLDGQAVTTAAASAFGDYVGIFNVATLERHRGHGYGAAVTARAVLDGFESGASIAYLLASAMGYKVYERLGFKTLETWSVWLTAPPSRS